MTYVEVLKLCGSENCLVKAKSSSNQGFEFQGGFLNYSKFIKWCVVVKGVILSDPRGIMSPLHLHHFHSSGASKDTNHSLWTVCISQFRKWLHGSALWCVHLFKTMQAVLFSLYVSWIITFEDLWISTLVKVCRVFLCYIVHALNSERMLQNQ